MTQERDIERLLDTWFADGPTEAPDRVLDDTAFRIHRQRQRPAWLLDRRPPTMSGPIRLLAIAAVLIGVVAIGSLLFAGGGSAPAPLASPSATPASTPEAIASAAPSPIPFTSRPVMDAGTYVKDLGIGKLTFTLGEGWASPVETPMSFTLRLLSGPEDATLNVWTDMRRPMKDAACTEAPDPTVDATAAALIASLRADPELEVSEPATFTLPGLTGSYVDIRTSSAATGTCPFSNGNVTVPLVVDTNPGEGPFWLIGPGEVERLFALDTADGHTVTIVVDAPDSTSFGALDAATHPLIGSMAFAPAP